MNSIKIAVLSKIPNLIKELSLKLPNATIIECETAADPNLSNVEIIIADFNLIGPLLYDIPHVKFVQGTWAGIDALIPHIKDKVLPTVPIFRYSGQHFGRIISEYVLTCIVNHEREFYNIYENQITKMWIQDGKISNYRIISDLNIGIMGIGQIGSRLGKILETFGAQINAYGRRPTINKHEFEYVNEYFNKWQLNEFLSSCDYIINTLPNTEDTKGLLNGHLLRNCKEKNTVFINVGRGSIIDDNYLIQAVENKWISAAYLDVFNTEPLPKDSGLWSLSQVKITPHVAAMGRAKDISEQFLENLKLFNDGKPIPTLLDFKNGY